MFNRNVQQFLERPLPEGVVQKGFVKVFILRQTIYTSRMVEDLADCYLVRIWKLGSPPIKIVFQAQFAFVNQLQYDCGRECFGDAGYAELVGWPNLTSGCQVGYALSMNPCPPTRRPDADYCPWDVILGHGILQHLFYVLLIFTAE